MATNKQRGLASIVGVGAAAWLYVATPGFEGEKLTTYRDFGNGVLTYCDGATENAIEGKTYTPTECRAQLDRDLARHAEGVAKCVPMEKLTSGARAAFVDFSYNLGVAAFCGSSAARYARAGDVSRACDALLVWDGVNRINPDGSKTHIVYRGLAKRRAIERDICLKGIK